LHEQGDWKNETSSKLEEKCGVSVTNSNLNQFVKLHFLDFALKKMESEPETGC